MQNRLIIIFLPLFLILKVSCSPTKIYEDTEKNNILINSRSFTFIAEKVNPIDMDAINILNSYLGGSPSILTLSPGYSLTVTPKSVTADLPYFGRLFIPNLNPQENGLKFTSENFTIDKLKSTAEKQVWIIDLNDVNSAQQLYFEIFTNKNAILSVNSKDRQTISYFGYITNGTEN